MANGSRRGGSRAKPAGTGSAASGVSGTAGSSGSRGPTGGRRAGRRETARPPVVRPSFVERYRGAIIGGVVVVAVGVVAAFLLFGSTQSAYACDSEWTAPSPAASAAPDTGAPQPDMGRSHVAPGQATRYAYCPPASGPHYNDPPLGPIPAAFYTKDDTTLPQGWIHNLEHGGLVLLYRCGSNDTCDTSQQDTLRQLVASFPASPVCKLPPRGQSPSPVVTRFDQMATPYAALVWGRVLQLQTLDTAAVLRFYETEGERTNPESQCQTPNATPGMTIAPSPSPS